MHAGEQQGLDDGLPHARVGLTRGLVVIAAAVLIGGFGCAAALMWFTQAGREFAVFSRESWDEAKRVVWPSRKETIQTTAIVFVFVVVMALFLFAVDTTLQWIIKLLTGRTDG